LAFCDFSLENSFPAVTYSFGKFCPVWQKFFEIGSAPAREDTRPYN